METLCVEEISLTGLMLDLMKVVPSLADQEGAALHLLDWLGCALAGAATSTGRAMAVAAGANRVSIFRLAKQYPRTRVCLG